MEIEINENYESDETGVVDLEGATLLLAPPVDEEYWLFRVKLYKDQAILCFPKFMTLGIGFAIEKDWNTNLPYTCDTSTIYNHIKHNKKYKKITDEMCLEAISKLQDLCIKYINLKSNSSNAINN